MKNKETLLHRKILAACVVTAIGLPVSAATIDGYEPGYDLDNRVAVANESVANDVSPDGSIVVGRESSATIWSGSNWSNRTVLGGLNHVSGDNVANSISADGSVVVGSELDHALVWSGPNWSNITDLNPQEQDAPGPTTASANSVSADGSVVVGAYTTSYYSECSYGCAVVWSGSNWNTKTVLEAGMLARASGVSDDGSVVVGSGYEGANGGPLRAFLWTGPNWSTRVILSQGDESGAQASAEDVSGDGSVVVGYLKYNHDSDRRAIVWSGTDWRTETDLGTLKSDNSGNSSANAISADGSVVVGKATTDRGDIHATVWADTGWGTKIDLGTLKSDNSGNSSANAISDDGSVVVGEAITDEGNMHATVWKIKWPDNVDGGGDNVDGGGDNVDGGGDNVDGGGDNVDGGPDVVTTVDVDNSLVTMNQVADDTFVAMELQRQWLVRLQSGCDANAKGESCGQLRTGFNRLGSSSETDAGFSYAYGVTDNLSVGVSLDRTLNRSLPESYRKNNNNLGTALYARWRHDDWFIRSAVSANQFDADVVRPQLSNTEAGRGSSKMKGFGLSLSAGQDLHYADGNALGWEAGVRYSKVSRNGYTETNAEFPVSYKAVNYATTSAFVGGIASHPVADNVKLVTRIQAEQDISGSDAELRGGGAFLGGVKRKADMAHTRGWVSAGVDWNVRPDTQVSVMPYVGNSALGDASWGGDLRITTRF